MFYCDLTASSSKRNKLVYRTLFLWGILLGATTPVLTALISRSTAESKQGYILGLVQSISQFASMVGIALGGEYLFGLG